MAIKTNTAFISNLGIGCALGDVDGSQPATDVYDDVAEIVEAAPNSASADDLRRWFPGEDVDELRDWWAHSLVHDILC